MTGVPLDFRVDIAPDADPDAEPATWTWLDVSSYRRQTADITFNYGRADEDSEVEAGDASVTFDMRDGLLSPRNPSSSLYGRIGVNTPIRLRLPIDADTFDGRTVASGLGTASSGLPWSSSASWAVSSGVARATLAANVAAEAYLIGAGALDVDITYSASLSAVMTGGPWVSALLVRRVDSANQYRVHTEFKPSGVITIKLVRRQSGTNIDVIEDLTTAATYSIGTKVWTRVVAEGGFLRAKVWSGLKSAEPATWDITSTLVRIEGETSGYGFYQWRLAGTTNPGNVVATLDDFTVDALIWGGNVPEWPPRWDKSGQDASITVAAAGPLRRLNQGDDPVKSPLSRQLPRYRPGAYWPLEDGASATSAASATASGRPARVNAVTFAGDDTLPGASTSIKFADATSSFRGAITSAPSNNFAAMLFFKTPTIPGVTTTLVEWKSTTGTIRRWQIILDVTGYLLKAYDIGDSLIHTSAAFGWGLNSDPTDWSAVQLEARQVGVLSVDYSLIWNRVGNTTFFANAGNIAANIGRLSEVYIPPAAGLADASFGHIYAGDDGLPFVDQTFLAVSSGYAGELASDRIARLCAEQNVAVTIHPGASEPLGAQRPGKLLDLLREAGRADLGVLYERSHALGYIPRYNRYNAPVKLALDWSGGDLAEAPEPTDDDQRLRNRWTVKRTNGSEVTYEDATSIARHGAIGDSAEVNIATDDRLPDHAAWRTNISTRDELRWPTVQLDLVAHPELIPQFLSCRVGSRLTIANPKAAVAGVAIDLTIEHISQTIGRHAWDVTLTCSPARAWDVGVWSATGAAAPKGRWGSRTTTLRLAVSAGATAWSISTTNIKNVWSTSAVGYQWDVAGETVTVASVGAPTGTGPYVQAVTVTRAQNGVSKAQAAGTAIRMAQPARWAL